LWIVTRATRTLQRQEIEERNLVECGRLMLTDIFADRYATVTLWDTYGERERRLIVQSFRILSEQICPYYTNGEETERGKAFWEDLQSRIAMELGLKTLAPKVFFYNTQWNGQTTTGTTFRTMHAICETWMLAAFVGSESADRYIKDRLSLVELGFRKREEEIAKANAELPSTLAIFASQKGGGAGRLQLPGLSADSWRERNATTNKQFADSVDELNTRLRQAACSLHYHNGFIQMATDALSTKQIEEPFWHLVSEERWKNVDVDMKEAIDRRDTGGRDPALYAARALESTIKILSDEKGWTHGGERGAHNYIDNLAAQKNGKFISVWETEALKQYFTKVRNPLGHGPGNEPMPTLTAQQTDWAVESAMAWIKSLVRRL
jgi:hypothetical protein